MSYTLLKWFLVFWAITLISCEGPQTPITSHGGPLMDHVSLVDHLRAAGNTVEPKGSISQPFFSVPGQTLGVNGNDVQVFEFGDSGLAEEEAEKISPDGSTVGGSKISWIATPHFFKKGKVIVLYLGTNQKFLESLSDLLGPQIAGG